MEKALPDCASQMGGENLEMKTVLKWGKSFCSLLLPTPTLSSELILERPGMPAPSEQLV